ncbi:MAG: serine/threonine protein kinase [Polyangiales bacterium]
MSPQVLGRYELLREIASGGMATVYAARAAGAGGFQKLVAVKRMLPHMTSEQRFKDMFLDEARLTANIRSPYAVATLDLGEAEDGSLYLVMDLVIGSSFAEILRGAIKQGRVLPIPAVVEIVQQAARGLHDAHEATTPLGEPLHIVHRDVSPQNILVGIDGASRITDFGVAHALERITKTKGRNIKGKLAYCSPEQARGDALDARSDVFALGIVLWEGLTHRRLFKGKSTTETITALLSAEIPDPRTLRPEIPARLATVVQTALQRNPEERYQSALEFAEDLRRAVEEHVRTEDLRDLVKLIAGDHIAELVTDIRSAIEASSTPASRTWDDSPTKLDGSPAPMHESRSQASTLDSLKQTGRFLARPPSEAMMAASEPSFQTIPALANFSSSFEGPGPVQPPVAPAPTPSPAPAPVSHETRATFDPVPTAPAAAASRGKWALVLLLVCVASAAVTAPLLYWLLGSTTPESIENVVPPPSSEVAPSPIATAPPLGLDAPAEEPAVLLAPGFEPRLWRTEGQAGGSGAAREFSSSCTGYVAEQPQHIIELETAFSRLRIFVHSDMNTSLVVRSSSGAVYCNDDAEGLNPLVDQAFAAGRYEIFVASPLPSQHPNYTLGITEYGEYSPRSFQPAQPSSMRAHARPPRRASRMAAERAEGAEVVDPWVSGEEDVAPSPPPARQEQSVTPRAPILR